LDYNNFGFTFGGPIQRDQLFFFYSQEWRKITRAPASVTANVPQAAWLNDPANANYVAPALRDPNAVKLLEAWPAPNLGAASFLSTRPDLQDTRQEVGRLDYTVNPRWRLMARFTHDLSETREDGGLFFNTQIPNVATTATSVPGRVGVLQAVTTISPNMLNEFSFQYSANDISTTNPDGTRNKRSDYDVNISELFTGNPGGLIPSVAVTGLTTIGSNQLFDIEYRNYTFTDNLTWQRGNHSLKGGLLVAMEQKNENANSLTQGSFNFVAGGGFTAFQNFLRGNAAGACGGACTYTEAETDVVNHLRFHRYEFYVQDSWKARPDLTLDFGLRYSLFPSVVDTEDVLTNFDPALYSAANAPRLNAAGGVIVGTGDTLNGIVVAGANSAHGRGIYATDHGNLGPRLGFTWDLGGTAHTLVRRGVGVYYDQPLVGIFEQNAFVNPPFNNNV